MPGIAIVGASEKNPWFGFAEHNLRNFNYSGSVWPVNPNYASVGGWPSVATLDDINGELDAVIIAVAAQRCAATVRQAVDRGAIDIAVVSNGFAELDSAEGRSLQSDLVAAAGDHARLYGPNSLGFADFRRGICAIAEPVPETATAGSVSVASQSGAILSTLMSAVVEDGLGLDWCVSLGNSASFDLARTVNYVVDRGTTEVLCVYAESLGNSIEQLAVALERAGDAGITIVMLKMGRSDTAARIALSHTASVAGADAAVDAFLKRHEVIRVDSFEEAARVARIATMLPRRSGRGTLVVGQSGGSAAITSELAARDNVKLARLGPETREYLAAHAGPGSFLDNPLDVVMGRPGAGASTVDDLYARAAADEDVALVLSPWTIVFPDDAPLRANHRASIERVASTAAKSGRPTLISTLAIVPWTEFMLDFRRKHPEIGVVRGHEITLRALRHFLPDQQDPTASTTAAHRSDKVVGEIAGRGVLAPFNLPLVPGLVASDAREAAAAAATLRAPFVVKADVTGLAHKAKVGGVAVKLGSPEEVGAAVEQILGRLKTHGIHADQIQGFLIQEMVYGTEVLVGLERTSVGNTLTIGAGGVKAGKGTAAITLILPAREGEIAQACRASAGSVAPDSHGFTNLVAAVERLSEIFVDGSLDAFETVEINPIFVHSHGCGFADVLMVRAET